MRSVSTTTQAVSLKGAAEPLTPPHPWERPGDQFQEQGEGEGLKGTTLPLPWSPLFRREGRRWTLTGTCSPPGTQLGASDHPAEKH